MVNILPLMVEILDPIAFQPVPWPPANFLVHLTHFGCTSSLSCLVLVAEIDTEIAFPLLPIPPPGLLLSGEGQVNTKCCGRCRLKINPCGEVKLNRECCRRWILKMDSPKLEIEDGAAQAVVGRSKSQWTDCPQIKVDMRWRIGGSDRWYMWYWLTG